MLIQIFIGTGVREFIDEQIKFYGRENKDLWTELDILANEFEISWNWVKAHSTDELNNEVDLIAKEAANL